MQQGLAQPEPGGDPESLSLEAEVVAELLQTLLRELTARMYSGGLNPAQWSALRFFARGSSRGRTLTDFARFHATTKGTASQTISALQRKGLVIRTRDPSNNRQVSVHLTEKAREQASNDPLLPLIDALGEMSDRERLQLALQLKTIIFKVCET